MKLWMSWLNLKTSMRLLCHSSESSGLNLLLDSNKRRHSQQFERANSSFPRPLRFGSLVPSFVAAGRRLCDVRRHFKAATQSLHGPRGPVRLDIASGRRPREQGRRSLGAYSKGRRADWNIPLRRQRANPAEKRHPVCGEVPKWDLESCAKFSNQRLGPGSTQNGEVGDQVLGDPGSVRTGPVAASPFGSPR
ncbi:unnamed protein product [Sphagnum balticum]